MKTDYFNVWVLNKTDLPISTAEKYVEILRMKQFLTKKNDNIFRIVQIKVFVSKALPSLHGGSHVQSHLLKLKFEMFNLCDDG